MVKIEIVRSLVLEIKKKFKKTDANKVLDLIQSVEKNPRKGKLLGNIGGIIVKELKYKGFRFYFLTDGFKLKCMDEESLSDLLILFVRMSDKKHQKETIAEIKRILLTIGPEGF